MDTFIALIVDVRDSRRLENFTDRRDRALRDLSKRHRTRDWLDADYAVTAWDEFQALIVQPPALPKVLWDVYKSFRPWSLKLGVGGGGVDRQDGVELPINEAATGEAFFLARDALESLEGRRQRTGQAGIMVAWNEPAVAHALNAALRPLDLLISAITDTQWQAIELYETSGRQDEVARKLDKSESTISRTLSTARYWDIRAGLDDLSEFLRKSNL